eukprot:jgi/Bigna1/126818/aug1.3_g1526
MLRNASATDVVVIILGMILPETEAVHSLSDWLRPKPAKNPGQKTVQKIPFKTAKLDTSDRMKTQAPHHALSLSHLEFSSEKMMMRQVLADRTRSICQKSGRNRGIKIRDSQLYG